MLFFITLLPVLAVYSVSAQISISNVPKIIYENINMYYVKGPTVEDKIEIKLVDGLSLTEQPYFDTKLTTVFYFHGWAGAYNAVSANTLVTAFLKKKIRNFVVFDYSELVRLDLIININIPSPLGYLSSVNNATNIGNAIGQFLKQFIPSKQPKELIHLLSHSLGSQIMSHAARTFGAGQLWLTGLDPAGFIYYTPFLSHLQASDGSFVDVIHTSGSRSGDGRKIGTVDILVNGGTHQAECPFDIVTSCSHRKSWEYYAEAIVNETAFPAKQCTPPFHWLPLPPPLSSYKCNNSDIIYMGLNVNKRANGSYYLKTRADSPYGMGTEGLDL